MVSGMQTHGLGTALKLVLKMEKRVRKYIQHIFFSGALEIKIDLGILV